MKAIRDGRDADASGFIALIGACWAEYPGCVLDVDGEVPELRALASHFADRGGALWAAEDAGGGIVGMVGTAPVPGRPTWQIERMYVAASERGTGLAEALLRLAEGHALAQGAAELALHSDTRFERAHRFYEKASYLRSGPIKVHHDRSNTLEAGYAKPVNGVVVLDAAAAESAERRLAEVLRACVLAGASVSFMPPLPEAEARGFWRRAARQVALGERILLAGYADGELVGTVTVDCAMPPNQPQHGALQKMLVHPAARRRGLGRALLRRAEQEAAARGRTLLTLDTARGSAAEPLYRAEGWVEVGVIPRYALNPDGSWCDTVVFYKQF